MTDVALDHLSVNAIGSLAIDAVEEARSGHPKRPLGAAPMAYMLRPESPARNHRRS